MENKEYTLFSLIEIRFADPISAISISTNFLIIGSTMGRITLHSLEDGKTVLISEISTENISGISFSNDEYSFFVAIGDEQVLKFPSDTSIIGPIKRILNYPNEKEHNIHCENSFIFLYSNFLFKILLSPLEERNITIVNYNADFEIKNLNNEYCEKGTFNMTNYSVPLDFDSEKFSWVEFLSDKERNLCIVNLGNKLEKPIKLLLQRSFGHISHFKFLPGNKFILVRNLNICEIRNIDEKFTLIQSFKHLGDNVYAIDVFVLDKKRNINDNNLSYNSNKRNKDDILLNLNKNESFNSNEHNKSENINNKIDSNDNNDNNKDFIIVFLDIDGGVNIYQNGEISSFFNLNDLKGIKKEEKNKTFFSMGYSYYIKYNLKYCIISSDHGCYVLELN